MKQRKRSGGVEFLFQLWYHEKKGGHFSKKSNNPFIGGMSHNVR